MTARGRPSISIVGAGIGGLAAALALRRAGLRARVFERTSRFTRARAGLQMAPNEAIARIRTLMRSALYGRDPLPRWSYGRVSMLGDACHPMLLFLAPGAGAAIEGAVVLSRCLRGADADGIPEALARYEQARQPRVRHAGWLARQRIPPWQGYRPGRSAGAVSCRDLRLRRVGQPLTGGRTIPAATTNAGRSQR